MDELRTITARLAGNPYPGRGIVAGTSADDKNAVFAYFIMGRSDNSRNRVLRRIGDSLYTRPYDDSKVKDPSLIIYRAAKWMEHGVVVTNGDQTDTICEMGDFAGALDTRTYEPDHPNYTPRISAKLCFDDGLYTYRMSILRRQEDGECVRAYWQFAASAGVGHILHTYQTDGNPLPSFVGAPREVCIPADIHDLGEELWAALDADNKIALYVCYIDPITGKTQDLLYNKHEL